VVGFFVNLVLTSWAIGLAVSGLVLAQRPPAPKGSSWSVLFRSSSGAFTWVLHPGGDFWPALSVQTIACVPAADLCLPEGLRAAVVGHERAPT